MIYSKEFKQQAIKLSDEIGTQKACEQLGLSYFTLGGWRKKENRKRIMNEIKFQVIKYFFKICSLHKEYRSCQFLFFFPIEDKLFLLN